MNKSFGYDSTSHQFRIARHEIGDFGLHLSLIRSFSWGDNNPPELPFFPGKPLPYHYYFDLFVGFLEKMGVRIDIAFNGLSTVSFASLLFLIYKLPQLLFGKSRLLGFISVLLFLFHSSLTFIDFFKGKTLSASVVRELWLLPDYIHKGPFDGSVISIFFTLNVFLNQRHLIVGLTLSLILIYFLLKRLFENNNISDRGIFILGLLYGLSSRVHTLTFLSTLAVLFMIFLLFRQYRYIVYFFVSALVVFSVHARDILFQNMGHPFFNPGFLAEKPLTPVTFAYFWIFNLGVALLLIPVGFMISDGKQKKVFLSFFSLFVLGNLFQLSFRIDHNHSLLNLFLVIGNFYAAFFLLKLWRGKIAFKVLSLMLFSLMIVSGFIDLMPIKNDFQFMLPDAPKNTFMQWIKKNTNPHDIFLAKQEILDPVTLSGRKNYLGHDYYLTVMGYSFSERALLAKTFFEVNDPTVIAQMRNTGIDYIVIPKARVSDFPYTIRREFLEDNLPIAFENKDVIVLKL